MLGLDAFGDDAAQFIGVCLSQHPETGALVYRLLDFGLRRYIGESASFINGAAGGMADEKICRRLIL